MFRVGFEDNEDQQWDEGIRRLVLLQMSDETCGQTSVRERQLDEDEALTEYNFTAIEDADYLVPRRLIVVHLQEL